MLPLATYQHLGMPSRSLGSVGSTAPSGEGSAHGRVPPYGAVMVEVGGACTLTIYLWSTMSQAWVLPSSASASYQKTFAGAAMDYFTAPPGAKFALKTASGSVTVNTDADPVNVGL